MKKVLLIIIGVVCSLNAIALSYASPYKGAGRSGYIHSSAPIRSSTGSHSVMAQAPMATMGSTSSYGMQSASSGRVEDSSSDKQVRGIYTAASAIQGGVTTYDTAQRNVPGRRRAPGDPDTGEHIWVDNGNGTYTCTICGETISEDDLLDGRFPEHCVPIGDGWSVMLFFTVLAMAYGAYKKRTSTVQ